MFNQLFDFVASLNVALRDNLNLFILMYALILGYWPVRNMSLGTWFMYHPTSMTFSFVGLSLVGVIYKKLGGYHNTKLHGNLLTAGTLLGSFGFYVIYTNKINLGKDHFQSEHALYGLFGYVSYCSSNLVGALALHPDFGFLKTNQLIRKTHKYLSYIIMFVCWYAVVSGFTKMEKDPTTQVALLAPLFLMLVRTASDAVDAKYLEKRIF